MPRVFLIIISLALLGPSQGLGSAGVEAPRYCAKYFAYLGNDAETIEEKISAEVAERIERSLSENTENPEKGFNDAFDIYLDARLQKHEPELRNKLEGLIRKLKKGAIYTDDFTSSAAQLKLPESLKNSAYELGLLAHEAEHIIQNPNLDRLSKIRQLVWVLKVLTIPKTLFRMEYGAMRAEWEMLHSLPKSFRDAAILEMEKNYRKVSTARYFIQALGDSDLPFDTYLQNQHRMGRYSISQIRTNAAVNVSIASPFLTASFLLTYSLAKFGATKTEEAFCASEAMRRYYRCSQQP